LLRACERAGQVDDELMAGVFAVLKRWPWDARPTWVTWVPTAGGLAAQVAEGIAAAGKLAVADVVAAESARPASGGNSAFRLARVWSSLALSGPLPEVSGPVLVVFDRCDSRWTQTVVAHLLRQAGSGPVLPFALARA
jgi:ATP-dependent DNA helicase RecQ